MTDGVDFVTGQAFVLCVGGSGAGAVISSDPPDMAKLYSGHSRVLTDMAKLYSRHSRVLTYATPSLLWFLKTIYHHSSCL